MNFKMFLTRIYLPSLVINNLQLSNSFCLQLTDTDFIFRRVTIKTYYCLNSEIL